MKKLTTANMTGQDHYSVVISDEDGGPRIETDLSSPELAAVGRVCVQWAELEHALTRCTQALEKSLRTDAGVDFHADGFSKRLRGFRNLCGQLPPNARAQYIEICDRAANLSGRRDKVVHGRWLWRQSDDELASVQVDLLNPDQGYSLNLANIKKLATDVGELHFDLVFPGGLEQAIVDHIPAKLRDPKSSPVQTIETRVPTQFCYPPNGNLGQ